MLTVSIPEKVTCHSFLGMCVLLDPFFSEKKHLYGDMFLQLTTAGHVGNVV